MADVYARQPILLAVVAEVGVKGVWTDDRLGVLEERSMARELGGLHRRRKEAKPGKGAEEGRAGGLVTGPDVPAGWNPFSTGPDVPAGWNRFSTEVDVPAGWNPFSTEVDVPAGWNRFSTEVDMLASWNPFSTRVDVPAGWNRFSTEADVPAGWNPRMADVLLVCRDVTRVPGMLCQTPSVCKYIQ